jgi:N6-adenosine-specific RNA methylase IME4
LVARWRTYQEKEANRVTINLLKEDAQAKRKEDNENRFLDGCTVGDLFVLAEQGKKFSTILADPPWKFLTRSEAGEGRSAGQHYKTDRLAAIKALPVAQLAADDCVLLMWMVDWCPHWALEIIEAWGFAHKTTAFTWAKENASGEGWFMGQGFWTRANPEDCWLATRGDPKRLDASVRQLIVAPVMEHSRKPDEIHDRIEKLLPGPYLELYARRERKRWVTWGNEIAAASFANMAAADPETGEIVETSNRENALTPAPAEVPPEPPEGIPDFLRRESKPVVVSASSQTPTTAG